MTMKLLTIGNTGWATTALLALLCCRLAIINCLALRLLPLQLAPRLLKNILLCRVQMAVLILRSRWSLRSWPVW